ncbi:chromate efflux transporter [Ectobacillus funiculus]|jgi:chromate transporter|uniref:chromate efflux transporter n=1 Tax=Ectobacillus funiculus TaxID=137993 RepID=UPI00101C2493|nr:chromate efflux transporter [Ectobacillus funiculus]
MKQYTNIFWTALRLGCTSFGGPAAHIGYFRREYVERQKWLDEKSYADIVALANFLPGPASSQVGIAIGMVRGGFLGGLLAWLGFTLPSVLILTSFALFVHEQTAQAGWIHSLKLLAVAVVAQAVFEMGKKLAPDAVRQTIVLAAAASLFLFPSSYMQLIVIGVSGIVGYLVYREEEAGITNITAFFVSRKTGIFSLILFFTLLFGLPFLCTFVSSPLLVLFDTMYRSGAFVFGGGHVVLPLLETEIVDSGMMKKELFLAGYGVTQAVPGPLFTFSSYIGASLYGVMGAIVATIGIFLPAFLLILGGLPFWNALRGHSSMRSALLGINAGVVGILLAALYDPIFKSSVMTMIDAVLVLLYFALLSVWRLPSWLVVGVAFGCGLLV